jgi:Ser/Thr protein kinase RdoA (MazF antagonist)
MAAPPATLRALAAYGLADAQVAAIPVGLIHQSFAVTAGGSGYVLQRVSEIFSLAIHENIRAVSRHLLSKGIPSLELVPSSAGELTVDLGDEGTWRLLTRVAGVSSETCGSGAEARSAAALVARFHSALDDLDFELRPLGIVWHELPIHLRELRRALESHREHRLAGPVAALAEKILREAALTPPLDGLPLRVVHMDLKFNNVLFDEMRRDEAVSLIDLDTVCRLPLTLELGDAWRSWCNRSGEDSTEAELDLEIFRAAAEGYLGALAFPLGRQERDSLTYGLERLSLELSARFATDALEERYFGWEPEHFASHGDHNLIRARGQFSLYEQARETRRERARMLEA